ESILIPLCTTDPLISQDPKDREVNAGKKALEVDESGVLDNDGKDEQATRSDSKRLIQKKMQNEHINSTNSIHTVSTHVSTAGPSFANAALSSSINAVGTPNNVEEEVDMNNVVSSYKVPDAPFIKFLKDHPKDQAIGTKWVFRNKKDERGIVVKNKARLVAQGHTQEEGIDYDEVFAPVARIEAIRLFLTYASFKDFVVYQMDVKNAFLYGKIEDEVYVCQPPSFEDPDFPDKVYKVEKDLYELHQAPRSWYETLSTYLLDNGFHRGQIDKTLFVKRHKDDILLVQVQQKSDGIFLSQNKYMAEILKKNYFATVKTASTLIEPNKALIKDEEAKDVDVHLYRSMIGSLMHLTASKPDITFAVCACARDSPFDLEAFSDSDYAGASLDRKSTTRGCQFLGKRLISWQCKKQTIVANSTTEAEYVAAAN
ncbi:putative ribonuclease H-like domain-containing protein, partial [Tanacetum coccineum]